MNQGKLCSDEVPQKFTDWLLHMGYPADQMPTADKVAQMCRGYYMVWRSLMEHVHPRDVIRQKRLQVFINDKINYESGNRDAIIPKELEAWLKHEKAKRDVEDAEKRVAQAQHTLKKLTDEVSSKLYQRNQARVRAQDCQRRVYFLQAVNKELKTRTENMLEKKNKAEAIRRVDENADIQAKMDKFVSSLPALSLSSAGASSSVFSAPDDDTEKHLLRSPANKLWATLLARRDALADTLAKANRDTNPIEGFKRVTPEIVAMHSAEMHCVLSLATVKDQLQLKQSTEKFEEDISFLSDTMTGPACEFAVIRFERASAEARVAMLRELLGDLQEGRGIFQRPDDAGPRNRRGPGAQQLHKAIIRKKEDIKSLLDSMTRTDRMLGRVRQKELAIFLSLQQLLPIGNDVFRAGTSKGLARDPTLSVPQFYQLWCTRAQSQELSMDMDVSDTDIMDTSDVIAEPTFSDELKIYLKKFILEKNMKLVLESGEKVWVFETLDSTLGQMRDRWIADDVTVRLLCPSTDCASNVVAQLLERLREKSCLEKWLRTMDGRPKRVDFTSAPDKTEEYDSIKWRLADSLKVLRCSEKRIDIGEESLQLWEKSPWRKYVSPDRTVDGKTYKEYEAIFRQKIKYGV